MQAMLLVPVILVAFLAGVVVSALVGRFWFREGLRLGRDDRFLDPGSEVGQIMAPPETAEEKTGPVPVVGESSGRHAMPEPKPAPKRVWPPVDEDVDARMAEALCRPYVPMRQEVRA